MGKITEVDMLCETEKMTCKHKYGQQTFNKANGRNLEPDSVENKTIETKIREMWSEIRKDIIYDPCERKINFNNTRPTEYEMNKRVKLPKSLKIEAELECEIRKRAFIKTFDRYKIENNRCDEKQENN